MLPFSFSMRSNIAHLPIWNWRRWFLSELDNWSHSKQIAKNYMARNLHNLAIYLHHASALDWVGSVYKVETQFSCRGWHIIPSTSDLFEEVSQHLPGGMRARLSLFFLWFAILILYNSQLNSVWFLLHFYLSKRVSPERPQLEIGIWVIVSWSNRARRNDHWHRRLRSITEREASTDR